MLTPEPRRSRYDGVAPEQEEIEGALLWLLGVPLPIC
jgi:hypothetical protein